jgi:hypothetical protein
MLVIRFFFTPFLLVTVLLAGCGTTPTMYEAKSIDEPQPLLLGDNEVLITGKIIFIENGKSKAPYGLGRPNWMLLHNPDDLGPHLTEQMKLGGREIWGDLYIPFLSTEKDGSFYYIVPAGEYLMKDVVPFYYTPYIFPAVSFNATQPGKIYYIGTLSIDIDTTTVLGGLWGNYINTLNFLEVKDEFDSARQTILEKFPGVDKKIINKALMKRLPGNFPTLFDPLAGMEFLYIH